MKKIIVSSALVSIGMSALVQQASAANAEIKVDANHTTEDVTGAIRSILADSGSLQLNQSTADLAKFLRDDDATIDVELILAQVEEQDQTIEFNNNSFSNAVSCYGNCHGACHGSRGWR